MHTLKIGPKTETARYGNFSLELQGLVFKWAVLIEHCSNTTSIYSATYPLTPDTQGGLYFMGAAWFWRRKETYWIAS